MNTTTKYLVLEQVEDSVSPLMIGTIDEIVSMLTKQSLAQKECESTEEEIREYYNRELAVTELSLIEGQDNKEYAIWNDGSSFEEFNSHNKGRYLTMLYFVYKMDDIATMQKYLTK